MKIEEKEEKEVNLVPAWQYKGNDGLYHNFEQTASDQLEAAYQAFLTDPTQVDVRSVKSRKWNYMVDFREFTQTNIDHENHAIRDVRRWKIPEDDWKVRKAYRAI